MSDDNDNIFREVDEEMRREQMAALWDRYGIFVIATAVAIVVSVAGYNFYSWREADRAAENGRAFYQATQLVEDGKPDEALQALSGIANNAPQSYRTLANLQMAATHVKEGRNAEAIALYDGVAQSSTDLMLKDFARLRAAALRVDEADMSEMRRRLDGLNTDKNAWRYSAKELLGLAAFRSGDTGESEKIFSEILGDPAAPAQIRQRAQIMMALLVKTSQRADSAPAGPNKDAVTQ